LRKIRAFGAPAHDRQKQCRSIGQRIDLVLQFRLSLLGFSQIRRIRQFRLWDITEELLDHYKRLFRVEIPCYYNDRVIGSVKQVKKVLDVFEGRCLQILEITIEIVSVIPVLISNLGHVDHRKSAVRLIEYIDLDFVGHNSLLVRQILLSDVQTSHSVSFSP